MLSAGCALGYRRGAKGGTWIAEFRDADGKRHLEALGAADDSRDPDGLSVYSFAQAQERARGWFQRKAREAAGDFVPLDRPYTIADALTDYRADYKRRGGKAIDRLDWSAGAWIKSEIGAIVLDRLTKGKIVAWHQKIAETPPAAAHQGRCRPEASGGRLQPRSRAPTPLDSEPGFDDPQGRAQPCASRRAMRQR